MTEDIQNRVREVAYVMWESAGRQHGMALEYWLAAEREVLATMQAAAERLMPTEAFGSLGRTAAARPKATSPEPAAELAKVATAPAAKPEPRLEPAITAADSTAVKPESTAKAPPRKAPARSKTKS